MAALSISFKKDGETRWVSIYDILYIEAENKLVDIYLTNGQVHTKIRETISGLMTMIGLLCTPDVHHCAHVGRKYIINTKYVKSVNPVDGKVCLDCNGCTKEILLSKPAAKELADYIEEFEDNSNLGIIKTAFELKEIPIPDTHMQGIPYVDLGLPSKTRWAAYNYGAHEFLENTGDYVAWGELSPKECSCGGDYEYDRHSERTFSDERMEEEYWKNGLPIEFDIANRKYAFSDNTRLWHIPTREQWEELQRECTWTWCVTKNNVIGTMVKGKNGNFIFLPACGCSDSFLIPGESMRLAYWSSNSEHNCAYDENAYCLLSSIYNPQTPVPEISVGLEDCINGMQIRPVLFGDEELQKRNEFIDNGILYHITGEQTCVVVECLNDYEEVEIPAVVQHHGTQFTVKEIEHVGSLEYTPHIVIPSTVENINPYAFEFCPGLQSIVVDAANSEYESKDGILYCKGLTELLFCPDAWSGDLIVPNTVVKIAWDAFRGNCNITSVSLPSTVTTLEFQTFADCKALKTVYIGNVRYICSDVFSGCESLTFVNLSNVEVIGERAFYSCLSLKTVNFGDKLKSIGKEAFCRCRNLEFVKLPDTVTDMGKAAFLGCRSMTNIVLGSGLTTIPKAAFQGCTSLLSIHLGDNITEIEAQAFYQCENLHAVKGGVNIKSIGNLAFQHCSALIDKPTVN